MIRALCTATGAVWWACAAIVLAVVGIGLLRAFWRDWRRPKCRYCLVELTPDNQWRFSQWATTEWRANLCGSCITAWAHRHGRLPREVLG